jgi:hypothetical protein
MKRITSNLKYLGYYQLIGGIIGTFNTFRFIPNFDKMNGALLLFFLLIFTLFGYSIFCGYLLIKKQYSKGLNLSIYNQFIQIISFGVMGYAFSFTSGIYAGIKLNLTNDTILTFMFGYSEANIQINTSSDFTELSLNFVSIVLLNLIFNLKSKLDKFEITES